VNDAGLFRNSMGDWCVELGRHFSTRAPVRYCWLILKGFETTLCSPRKPYREHQSCETEFTKTQPTNSVVHDFNKFVAQSQTTQRVLTVQSITRYDSPNNKLNAQQDCCGDLGVQRKGTWSVQSFTATQRPNDRQERYVRRREVLQ